MSRVSEFSTGLRRDFLKRAQGRCECSRLHAAGIPGFSAEGCGEPIGKGNQYFEHIIPEAAGGRSTYRNGCVLTAACWRRKTTEYDQPLAAKVTAQSLLRLDRQKAPSRRPIPGSIASGWRKPMRGNAARRDSDAL